MATRATPLDPPRAGRSASWTWFRQFLRWELAPYPGRTSTVVRMTIATTLVMLIVMTFRIPNGALAGLFSILLARENLAATWRGGRMIVLAFVLASFYTLIGMMLFRGFPLTHFFWVIASLYLIFFVIRTATNYAAAAAFAVPIGVALPVWDRSMPSQIQVEETLWPVLVIAVAAGATVATELLYRIFDDSDPLLCVVDDMLLAVQQVTTQLAAGHALSPAVLDRVRQYDMIGTGRLRVTLQRQGPEPGRRAQRSALISLAGRLPGLASKLGSTVHEPGDDDRIRLRALSERLAAVRADLRESGLISASVPAPQAQSSPGLPLLPEMEQTVALMTQVFQLDGVVDRSGNTPGRDWWRTLLLPDAFQNPEYTRFAFAGCLAASVCYVLYNALDWPGISTCVLTCIVTALSTIGSSVQAQIFRLSGFVAGGVVMGISAQILILPGVDTVFGFALFFAGATAIAAWFATSSPRLSFFGVQMALSFYFVHLQDFHIQTDLTIARDRVLGVLLGILAMGFIFDRFGTKSDAERVQTLMVRTLRLLGKFADGLTLAEKTTAISQTTPLRSQINENFASLESQMDAVRFEFEFRHRGEKDAVECERFRRLQPVLRSIYLLELVLLFQRERRESDTRWTRSDQRALDQFLNHYREQLVQVAGWIADEEDAPARFDNDSILRLLPAPDRPTSPTFQTVVDVSEKMVSSLRMLREQC